MSRFRPTIAEYADLPKFDTLATYPNSRHGHTLKRYRDGTGLCSCQHWQLWDASESSLIRSHQYHVTNVRG